MTKFVEGQKVKVATKPDHPAKFWRRATIEDKTAKENWLVKFQDGSLAMADVKNIIADND